MSFQAEWRQRRNPYGYRLDDVIAGLPGRIDMGVARHTPRRSVVWCSLVVSAGVAGLVALAVLLYAIR